MECDLPTTQDQRRFAGARIRFDRSRELEPGGNGEPGWKPPALDPAVRNAAPIEDERLKVKRLLAAVAQKRFGALRAGTQARPHHDERRVVDLYRNANRTCLKVVALAFDSQVRIQVSQDAGVRHLDTLVPPRALAVDPEGPR